MLTRMKKMLKKQKGFTLVELLAVIAILAIIVAIAVPTVGNVISKSEEKVDKANIELIENAARLAEVDGATFPISVSKLQEDGYLEEVPTLPEDDTKVYSGNVVKDATTGQIKYTKE
ncbi:prepilin-type N-terminal cleavage/methylation domain-containing protein [Virgibacillus halodenitrificans]|uniref:prepilin-type N-terminal cleavage/methylation domain-containing protein n=1 Tax=Virgibacillus halodenitrificans TaxID=1482 RepID=UPI0013687076|nr:prepilin-type N-terminal cleavage/methylation domain-containing protein [Virgibacillus halodenitrificans]MYL44798.1 prepilin-type N-terminal cleavage/methylation domain-containing protein [Virgibacillus halodenitrificans]